MTSDDPRIVALLREREHYVRRGRKDRVAEVDAVLKRLDYAPETTSANPPPETTAEPHPRRTNAQQRSSSAQPAPGRTPGPSEHER